MPAEKDWNLPVAFHFEVKIDTLDIPFKEVSGLDTEMETESVREGGSNDFEYTLPKQIKHGNLVLKRALLPLDSPLIAWIKGILEGYLILPVMTKDIQVSLLNEDRNPMYIWTCSDAYPVKWSMENLDAEKNSVLIESLEFTYTTLKRS